MIYAKILAVVLLIALGIYIGGWVCFIGGLVDIINVAKAPSVDAFKLAIGICKVVFCEVPMSICIVLALIIGR